MFSDTEVMFDFEIKITRVQNDIYYETQLTLTVVLIYFNLENINDIHRLYQLNNV